MALKNEPSPLLDAALSYAARGWHVLPLKPRAKTPLTRHGLKDASTDENQIREWWGRWPRANIGIACGPSGLAVVDVDVRSGGNIGFESLFAAEPETLNAFTGSGDGSRHWYFAANGESCRVLAPGLDLKGDGGYVVVPPSIHPSGEPYRWEASSGPDDARLAQLPPTLRSDARKPAAAPIPDVITSGERNTVLTSLAGSMRRRGASQTAIRAALHEENASRCAPPLPDAEVDAIAASVARYAPADACGDEPHPETVSPVTDPADEEKPWPRLDEAALHGLAGEFVRLVEEDTEADPAAILVQLLVAIGSILGRKAGVYADGTTHFSNLFAVILGKTAFSRKGTSWGVVQALVRSLDEKWTIRGGLSTGEGLIACLHDPYTKTETVKYRGEVKRKVVEIPGVEDKRLLVLETEFVRVLKVIQRRDNTLREVLLQAWDGQPLGIITRADPLKATGTHVSIIGHCTLDLLRRYLDAEDISGGFGNRLLFCLARRARTIPTVGRRRRESMPDLAPLRNKLLDAITQASYLDEVLDLDDEAAAVYADAYTRELNGEAEKEPLASLVARAAPTLLRLALVYHALDQGCDNAPENITSAHIQAARAVVRYGIASADYVFGQGARGNPTAMRILKAAQTASDGTITREAIFGLFKGHGVKTEIDAALRMLAAEKKLTRETIPTAGRPREVWRVAR
jgi:hypothetical protein